MSPDQHRAELAILRAQAHTNQAAAIEAQLRAYNPYTTDRPEDLWAVAEAAEQTWLTTLDLIARGERALIEALIQRDREGLQVAHEKYENGEVA